MPTVAIPQDTLLTSDILRGHGCNTLQRRGEQQFAELLNRANWQ